MLEACQRATGRASWASSLGAGPVQVSIDPNGNLASKTEGTDNWTYTWNAENQLTRVEKNGAEVARFAYDPLGRRVEKVAGGVTTAWVYDDAAIVRETRGSTTLRYVHGAGLDESLAVDGGASPAYYHADGLGSVVQITDASGAITLTRQYSAWGGLESASSQGGYTFTGREWDPEVSLYYYRARYYDSAQGRFISEDPAGLEAGDANLYPYAGNQPVVNVDPSGLAWCLYDISSHSLQCRSTRTGKTITIPPPATSSGSGSCQDNPDCVDDSFRGPVVPGVYRMNRDTRPEHRAARWWRLEAIPPVTGWEYYTGQKRSGMAMHAGTRSVGCINVNKNDPSAMRDYNALNELLLSEDGSNFMGVMK